MTRFTMAIPALAALMIGAGGAEAQVGMPYQRPSTSPYFRPAVSPILNSVGSGLGGVGYYTLTRPQEDAFRSIGQLQTGYQNLALRQFPAADGSAHGGATMGQTGHPATFFNYSHYYTYPAPRFGPGSSGSSSGYTPPQQRFGQPPQQSSPSGIGIVVNTQNRGTDPQGK